MILSFTTDKKMDNIYISIIEALIFASDEPITSQLILNAIKEIDGDEVNLSTEEIEQIINNLNSKYSSNGFSFSIVKVANGYLFATKPEYGKYVGYLSTEKSKRRLSQAALETLAIIAYKQPITKPELESIRGVNSDYIINTLLEKNLVTITGRSETVGRPLLYGTTDEFLKYFGLYQISDLPKPREIEEIMKDEDFIEQKQKIMMNALEENIEKESGITNYEDNEAE
jgi:segregation and condensation protein B